MESDNAGRIAKRWKRAGKRAWRVLHAFLAVSGALALALAIFLCTAWPQRFLNWTAHAENATGRVEDAHVVFVPSGAGMPSESALMRLWTAGEAARRAPHAQVAVGLPPEDAQVAAHREELVLRGVAPERIKIVFGRSTREQAVALAGAIPARSAAAVRVAVVTSPSHVRRTAAAVAKVLPRAGICALPAWNGDFASNLSRADDAAGEPAEEASREGKRELFLRYGLESNARAFLEAMREWVALVWYRLMRWA